jgi:uncharacterized repeat protein (TIGR01451 family)
MTQRFSKISRMLMASGAGLAVIVGAYPAIAQEGSNTTVNVEQNTIVVVPTPGPNEPADAVLFFMTDDREVVAPGELITYRIVVRNQRNDDINEVRITARIPDFVIPAEASPEADINPTARTITWNDVSLGGRAEQTYAIRAQIAPNAPFGYIVRTVAEINGPGVRGSFTDGSEVQPRAAQVVEQAATTVAPDVPATAPVVAVPQPAPVVPSARTGAATNVLIGLTTLGGLGLLLQRKALHY